MIVEVRPESGQGQLVPAPEDGRVESGRPVVSLPHRFNARPAQRRFMAHLDGGGLRAYLVAHRRYGKDLVALHQMCKAAHERKGLYWHALPSEEQSRKALWQGFTRDGQRVMEQVFPKSIRKSPSEWSPNATMVIELHCGSIVRLVGSDNVDSLVGAGLLGVNLSEFALCRPAAWPLLRPMVQETGGFATFLTTPRGRNFAFQLWEQARTDPSWFTETVDIFAGGAFDNPQEELERAKADGMPDALVQQEYLCSWSAANVGSVYGDLLDALEKRGAMEPFEHERDRCYTSWDIGVRDAGAVWVWRVQNGQTQFIDYTEKSGKDYTYFCDWLRQRSEEMGYHYVYHYLPWEASTSFWADVSPVALVTERLDGLGRVNITPQRPVEYGIQAARWLLQQKVRFHPRCKEGLDALKAYAYAYDPDKKDFSQKPEHTWASHGSDALRYAAVIARSTGRIEQTRTAGLVAANAPIRWGYTIDDLFRDSSPVVIPLRKRI